MSYNKIVLFVLGAFLIMISLGTFLYPTIWGSVFSVKGFINVYRGNLALITLIVGIALKGKTLRLVNLFIGLTLLYFAAASVNDLFPASYFKFLILDDILHADAGLILMLAAIAGDGKKD